MNKVTLCILRVSTVDQTTASQHALVLGEASKRGLTTLTLDQFRALVPGTTPPNTAVIVEDKLSGDNEEREGFAWALSQIKGGWIAAVIAWDVTRIGRSARQNLEVWDACCARETELYAVKDGVRNDGSAASKLTFSILSACAEYDLSRIRERTKAGVQRRMNTCEICGRQKDKHTGKEGHAFKGLRQGGTSKGWTHRRIIKILPRLYELIDLKFSNYHIRRVLGLNYRTIRKYRAQRGQRVVTRKELNREVYGKSDSVI